MADVIEQDYRGVDWQGRELAGEHYIRCVFADGNMSEVITKSVTFEDCDFSGANLNASHHTSAAFLRCHFRRTSMFGATLAGSKLTGSAFEGPCRLRPLTVDGGDWSYVSMRGQDLAGLDLTGVRLTEADLSVADLRGTILRGCDLSLAHFDGAKTAGMDVRDAELAAVDLQAWDLTGVRLDVAQAVLLARQHGAVI